MFTLTLEKKIILGMINIDTQENPILELSITFFFLFSIELGFKLLRLNKLEYGELLRGQPEYIVQYYTFHCKSFLFFFKQQSFTNDNIYFLY